MPIGWATTPQGKRRVLAKLDERIATLQDRRNALITKAGEAALNKAALGIEGIKREYEVVAEKIALLSEVRREVVYTDDQEW